MWSKFHHKGIVMRIQPHDADEIIEKLKFDGIYVNENFVDDLELINLTDDYNKLFSQDIKGTRKHSHPPGAFVSFMLDKLSAGFYFVKAKSEMLNDTKRLIIRK